MTKTTDNIWFTATLTIDTPRGERFQGVSYKGSRGPITVMPDRREALPRNAEVTYRSPLRIHANEAYELARSRTIHHNLWHDDTPDSARISYLHAARYCHEKAA